MRGWLALASLVATLAGCGGGSTTETSCQAPDQQSCYSADLVSQPSPSGPNTTEIVVDRGPGSGFSLGVANIPYVSVTVCEPGSGTACTTIDHLILDTGSYGLRLFKSKLGGLNLPPVSLPAQANLPAGTAVECYPFVIGGLWGPLALADIRMAEEKASGLPIQVIDDSASPALPPTTDCKAAAQNQLLASVSELQANGVLGIGPVGVDCGVVCALGDYTGAHIQYYACPDNDPTHCQAAPIRSALQLQNPVARFAENNNGTIITLPALPLLGSVKTTGRLVFGIGTQTNNQPPDPAVSPWYYLNVNDLAPYYLSISATLGTHTYPDSQIDSGSNAIFFDDPGGIPTCTGSSWYCPPKVLSRSLRLDDAQGHSGSFSLSIVEAQSLFGATNPAGTAATGFANLAGSVGQNPDMMVLGMPFFFGRSVYTAIWGQPLARTGPWVAAQP